MICIAAVSVLLLATRAHHAYDERGRRGIAEEITRALMARDVRSVAPLFAAGVREGLSDDVRLGAFADRLNGFGQLREIRELPSKGASNAHAYLAMFTSGEQREELTFEGDQVVGFTLTASDVVP